MGFEQYIAPEILDKFEYHNYGHALEILHESFPNEWSELQDCLKQLRLTIADISTSGGNESPIPKKFDDVLYPYGWREIRISGDLIDCGLVDVGVFVTRAEEFGQQIHAHCFDVV